MSKLGMPLKKHYNKGESVFGLWPGSGGLYFKGVVVDVDPADGTYDVKFEEGTTYTLLEKHVKPSDSFKALEPKSSQRGEVKRRGHPRSVSRSRSRSRSRTPGRKPQANSSTTTKQSNSVVRKSSRQKKNQSKSEIKQSPERELTNINLEAKKELNENEVELISSTRRSPRVKSAKKYYGYEEEEALEDIPLSIRKSSRLSSKIKVHIAIHDLIYHF